MKSKSSSSIPPDPDSVEQAIRRANYQVFHWVRCCEVNIETVSFENHGWKAVASFTFNKHEENSQESEL